MQRIGWSQAAVLVAALTVVSTPALASSFGTLSNFDVVNDTTHPCHGFEIELEDIHSSDVPYTFGGDYIRYGAPEVLDVTVDPAHPRVLVRYRRWTGSEWAATPVAAQNITPSGHDCFASGPVGNYLESGCEHFGVSLSVNPSHTTYRWLVAADPSDQQSAFTADPQPVNVPVPVWDVIPNPVDPGGVVVRAEVEPVEEENHAQHGEPQWMKVFKIESELDLAPEDLVKLLLGGADNILPDETEIETEWKLIQSKPGEPEGEEEDADVKEDPLDDGKRSVIRRYEFYTYIGPRDPENNEALPCIDEDEPVPADAPVEGCSDLGDFVGAQNAAVDIELDEPTPEPTATPTPTPTEAATATPTATPTVEPAICAGNCDGNEAVTVDELITLVNLALGMSSSPCPNGLPSGASVDIAFLVRAVGNALNGCAVRRSDRECPAGAHIGAPLREIRVPRRGGPARPPTSYGRPGVAARRRGGPAWPPSRVGAARRGRSTVNV